MPFREQIPVGRGNVTLDGCPDLPVTGTGTFDGDKFRSVVIVPADDSKNYVY